jgi:dipeptidyl aminopeptidase/acylaminoacyl peptidase
VHPSRLKTLLSATVLAAAAMAVSAQSNTETKTGPLPVAEYLKLPQFGSPRLSPSGKYLAAVTPINGRLNLAVVDLETRKGTALTSFDSFDVLNVRWVGDERLMFTLGQQNTPTGPEGFEGGGLFVVSRDGKESRKLSPTVREMRHSWQFVYRGMSFLSRLPGTSDEVLVRGRLRSADAEDVYRLDLRNGRTVLVTSERPPRTSDWVLDSKRVPRVVTSWVKDTSQYIVYYRKTAESAWEEIARFDQAKGPGFSVLGFLSDDKTLMVASNAGRETMGVFKFDPEARKLGELLAQHPRYDMGADAMGYSVSGVMTEADSDRVTGYRVDAERPQTVWLDEKEARTQAAIDAALPGAYNSFTRFPGSRRVLITSYSDQQPAKWYLLDEEKRTLEELFSSRPWLTGDDLVPMRSFLLKTRDGLEIPSYYFLPKGYKAGDRLPTVVHIHGGPHVRADGWASGFGYAEAQILASRGYAVVLPNFRITPGLGSRIYYSGFGTVGRQMSEDHEDAARWAVAQGFADPARLCMSGASYGGYATLRALAKTPELFKCGVAGLVVSDLEMQLTSTAGDTAYSPAGVAYWHKLVGQDDRNPTALKDNSPVHMAAKIKGALFMYAGSEDIRTPLEQTTAMVKALEAAGNPPKVVLIKKQEGHGYGKVENRIELYEKMLQFLDEQIGAKSLRP